MITKHRYTQNGKEMPSYKIRPSKCPVHAGQYIPKVFSYTIELGIGNGFWLCVACNEIRQGD